MSMFKNWPWKTDENNKDKESIKKDDNIKELNNLNSKETNDDVLKVLESVSSIMNEKRKEKGILRKLVEIDIDDEELNNSNKSISNSFDKSNSHNSFNNSSDFSSKKIKEKPENKKTNNISLMFEDTKLFIEHSQDFKGLYESFYQIKEGKYKNSMVILILEEYKGRIINIPELKGVKQFFEYVDTLKENEISINEVYTFVEWWLSYLKLCGITRDEKAGELEVFNGIGRFYNEEDDDELLIGDKVLIIKPYWKQNDIVLEKGMVKKIIENN